MVHSPDVDHVLCRISGLPNPRVIGHWTVHPRSVLCSNSATFEHVRSANKGNHLVFLNGHSEPSLA